MLVRITNEDLAGKVLDLPANLAQDLIDAGDAEVYADTPVIETTDLYQRMKRRCIHQR